MKNFKYVIHPNPKHTFHIISSIPILPQYLYLNGKSRIYSLKQFKQFLQANMKRLAPTHLKCFVEKEGKKIKAKYSYFLSINKLSDFSKMQTFHLAYSNHGVLSFNHLALELQHKICFARQKLETHQDLFKDRNQSGAFIV